MVGRARFELAAPAMSRLPEENNNFDNSMARWFESDIDIDWQQFNQFLLQRMNENTAIDRMRYAKQFQYVLNDNGNASGLTQLKPDARIHAMKALSNLAKFTGYDIWLQIRQRYNLNWSTGTEKLDAFTRFFDDNNSLDSMIGSLKEAIQMLPKSYSDFLIFSTLTGLRASETIESVRLICSSTNEYYDPESKCLEHFRFPQLFLRRTKAAYISIVDDEIIGIAKSIDKTPTYNGLKTARRRRNLSMQMKYCRKIYASYLRQSGIETEIIDLLQCRVPKSVFARHYFRPSADYKDRVLAALKTLRQKIL